MVGVRCCACVREIRERQGKQENRRESWKAKPHGGVVVFETGETREIGK